MLKISREEILAVYDHKDGVLYRRVARKGQPAGPVTGKNRLGYVRTGTGGVTYLAHRLIWIIHHGAIPEGHFVDHINGMRDDNRIENLRLVTHEQNQFNRGKYKSGKHKYKGVSQQRARFRAMIRCKRKVYSIGSYATEEEAALAYNKKAVELFGEHARLNEVRVG